MVKNKRVGEKRKEKNTREKEAQTRTNNNGNQIIIRAPENAFGISNIHRTPLFNQKRRRDNNKKR